MTRKLYFLFLVCFSINGLCSDISICNSYFIQSNANRNLPWPFRNTDTGENHCGTGVFSRVHRNDFPYSFQYQEGQSFFEKNCDGEINYFSVGTRDLIGDPKTHDEVTSLLQPDSTEVFEIVLKKLEQPQPYLCKKSDLKKCFKATSIIGSLTFSNLGLTDPSVLERHVQGTSEDLSEFENVPIHVGRQWTLNNETYSLFNVFKPSVPVGKWGESGFIVTTSYFCKPQSSISDSTSRGARDTNTSEGSATTNSGSISR